MSYASERARRTREHDRTTPRFFVYRLHDAEGVPVYVGRSNQVAERIRRHAGEGKPWMPEVRSVTMFGPLSWDDVVKAERAEVAALQPRGNIALTARDHRPATAYTSAHKAALPNTCPTCGSVTAAAP